MIDEKEKPVLEFLTKAGIEYDRFEHPAAASMEECAFVAQAAHAFHCKNLFLTNKRGTEFYLVLLARNKRFVTSVVSKLLGSTRLSFASDEQLYSVLGLTPGSVSAAGLLNDAARRVHVAIDRDILREKRMLIHPNVNTASLSLAPDDLLRFLGLLGYDAALLSVEERADAETGE